MVSRSDELKANSNPPPITRPQVVENKNSRLGERRDIHPHKGMVEAYTPTVRSPPVSEPAKKLMLYGPQCGFSGNTLPVLLKTMHLRNLIQLPEYSFRKFPTSIDPGISGASRSAEHADEENKPLGVKRENFVSIVAFGQGGAWRIPTPATVRWSGK
jgi:hypothetical protein